MLPLQKKKVFYYYFIDLSLSLKLLMIVFEIVYVPFKLLFPHVCLASLFSVIYSLLG